MVDWNSPEELAHDHASFSNIVHAMLGMYLWEIILSFEYDWHWISRAKPFRWPMIFYLCNRYFVLVALVGMYVPFLLSNYQCKSLYIVDEVFGSTSIGLASLNLSLRTIAVWGRHIKIVLPISILILAHWSLLFNGTISFISNWLQELGTCALVKTSNKMLAVTSIFTMAFDLLILLLTGWNVPEAMVLRSGLSSLVFGDGLIYFLVTFAVNLTATVLMLLNLNAVMSMAANVPAVVLSTIFACRAVRRLSQYRVVKSVYYGHWQVSSILNLCF
ncbi:hypothetical protein F5146DRAFT_937482 [Armillaria mellea]|nr:hypothetical protein F5146DRAFT_937482 [Armillaria mellea]